MDDSRLHLISGVFFCIFLLCGLASAQVPASSSVAASVQDDEAKLVHPGDLIDVDVVGSVEYDWRGNLNPEGFLDGIEHAEQPIYGLCQSEELIAAAIVKAYGKILRDPQIVVSILDRSKRPVSTLYGAVKTPQRLQIQRPVRLNELLILAGGLTDRASGDIQIYRPASLNCRQQIEKLHDSVADDGEIHEKVVFAGSGNNANYINIRVSDLLKGKEESNPQILSGDIITVQEAESIYVIGGVVNPGQIASRGAMTLSRAVDSVGGTVKGGDAKKITVYRREAGETKIIEADLEKIRSGQTADLPLKAFDIVEVAQRGREGKKFPPVLKTTELNRKNALNLPLRVID
ncbi:MAG: SLBB domain-containing protein [Acidobacteriota bacterium]|nr:SLBB domain-containing protein [Acidobacteriota bacterium]